MGGSAARLRDHGRIEPKILPRGAAGHPERPRPARRSGRGRAGSGTADRRRPRARWAGDPSRGDERTVQVLAECIAVTDGLPRAHPG